ncbi:vacuolar amino acid permease [Ephemerocybe angulata]|uniref:Vacuolar amino acid permease n=1 Tax=Ephemerocybe angulata TaxID=980116 RepID=A0A8H6IE97_9AGAR|nr:vacuolar amino acid permease [Tulosesus angulatus]
MSAGRSRPPSIETTSLLEEAPPSYRSTDDVSSASSSPVEDISQPPPPINAFSTTELAWMLAGLWSGVLLGAFDGTVVATLLTPIGSEFNASNQASYIGTSYLLSVCCFTPLYGRLADILGRKGAMLLALTLFGTGTILCGAAPSMNTLIAARAIAGMGGGGVMTVSSIAVTDLIPLQQRGLYQGVANVLYGVGAGMGGPVGGYINDKFGWRVAFYVQAPFFIFAIIVVATKVNIKLSDQVESQSLSDKIRRIDFVGSLTLVGSVGCMLLGFSFKTTEEIPWGSPMVSGMFIASGIFTVSFILCQKYWAPYPVMPLRLISQRTPLAVSLANLFASMSAFSMLYNAPLYFSAVRMENSATSGLYMLPHSIAIPTGSMFAGWLMRRTGKLYRLTLIASFMSIFASLLASTWNSSTPSFRLWADLLFQGFGMASFITSTLIAMITAVYKPDMPIATGITYLFRTTGQVLGVSLSGAVLQAVLLARLKARITGPGAEKIIHTIRHTTLIIPSLDPPIRQAAIDSYADALRVVFVCQTLISILAFVTCIPIEEKPMAPPIPPSPPPIPATRPLMSDTTDDHIDSSNA